MYMLIFILSAIEAEIVLIFQNLTFIYLLNVLQKIYQKLKHSKQFIKKVKMDDQC